MTVKTNCKSVQGLVRSIKANMKKQGYPIGVWHKGRAVWDMTEGLDITGEDNKLFDKTVKVNLYQKYNYTSFADVTIEEVFESLKVIGIDENDMTIESEIYDPDKKYIVIKAENYLEVY